MTQVMNIVGQSFDYADFLKKILSENREEKFLR